MSTFLRVLKHPLIGNEKREICCFPKANIICDGDFAENYENV